MTVEIKRKGQQAREWMEGHRTGGVEERMTVAETMP